MSFTVGGSTPQLTFADATVQNTAALPLTGGSVSADITVNGLTVGRGAGAVATNTSVGASALAGNTSGASNTSLGYQSLNSNTTANNNTAVGYQAGYNNTTGANNFFGGFAAGYGATGSFNTYLGSSAVSANSSNGSNNTAVGYQSLNSNTTGFNNTAVGYQAGQSITSGYKNTILGSYNGNQGGLDIRTANNNIVLSDGDGNPRQYYDSLGYPAVKAGASSGYQYVTKKFATVQSAVNNPTVSLVTFSGGTTNASCMIKVRVFQVGFVGGPSASGNEHIGLGWVYFSGSSYSTSVNTMTLTTNISNGNVGTLSWSGQTLQYTTNRATNYDSYYIEVEVTQNSGGGYTITLNF